MKGKLFKKLCAWLLSVMVILGAGVVNIIPLVSGGLYVSASSSRFRSANGILWEKSYDGTTVSVVAYNGYDANLIIPDSVGSMKVISIDMAAFKDNSTLKSVTIPDSVQTIGSKAFYQCIALENITIGNGVIFIGSEAFESTALKSVTIPDSVKSIGDKAFSQCKSLTDVTIGKSMSSIGSHVFYGCRKLEKFDVSKYNKVYSSLDGVLFKNKKTNLICCPPQKRGSYTIPDSVTNIEEYAFRYCDNLTSVVIPYNVEKIGIGAFSYCSGLSDVIFRAKTGIPSYMFFYCSNLKAIRLPSGITSIGEHAFTYCTSLREIIMPKSLTNINEYAFINSNENVTVYGYSGNYSMTYAQNHSMPFVLRSDELENVSVLLNHIVEPGKPISIYCDANGGDENYMYAAYYKKSEDSSWTTVQGYQKGRSIQFAINTPGNYDVRINVTDGSGTVARKTTALKIGSNLQNVSKLGANEILLGEKVKVRCFAEGGSSPYQYAVYYKKSSAAVWSKLRGYATGNILTLTPKAATSYDIRVDIKDADGTVASKTLKLTVNKPFANTSVLNTDSIKLGEKVKVRCFAEGGTSPYQYAVYYKKHSLTSWTKLRGYDEKNIVVLTPTAATTYDVRVDAADSAGNIATKTLTLKVTK